MIFSMDIFLRILFFISNKKKLNFFKLITFSRTYTITKVFSIIRSVKLVEKKLFSIKALDSNKKTYLVNIGSYTHFDFYNYFFLGY